MRFSYFQWTKKELHETSDLLEALRKRNFTTPGSVLPNFRQTLPEVHELQRNSADYFPAVSVICLQILYILLTKQEQKLNHARLGWEFFRVFLRLQLWSLHTVSFH